MLRFSRSKIIATVGIIMIGLLLAVSHRSAIGADADLGERR